jgi:hypothetical protein
MKNICRHRIGLLCCVHRGCLCFLRHVVGAFACVHCRGQIRRDVHSCRIIEILKTLVGFFCGIFEFCDELACVSDEFVKTFVEFTLVVIELIDDCHGAMNVCSELLQNVEFVWCRIIREAIYVRDDWPVCESKVIDFVRQQTHCEKQSFVVVLIVDSAMRSVGFMFRVFVRLHCCRYSIQCVRHVARSVVSVYGIGSNVECR